MIECKIHMCEYVTVVLTGLPSSANYLREEKTYLHEILRTSWSKHNH
jgi:hypothetical protein